MAGHGTCTVECAADNLLQLAHGPLPVVVHDGVVELRRELELLLSDVEPLVDLALALGRARPLPPRARGRARRAPRWSRSRAPASGPRRRSGRAPTRACPSGSPRPRAARP